MEIDNYTILSIVEFSAIFISVIFLQKIRVNNKSILTGCITSFIATLAFVNLEQWLAISIVFLIIIILLKLNGSSFIKILFDLSFIIFIGMIADHLAQLITYAYTESVAYIFTHIILFIFIYCILFSVIHYIFIKRKFVFSFKKNNFSKIFVAILIFITILFLYLNIFMVEVSNNKELLQFNLILQTSYFFISLIIIKIFTLSLQKEERIKYEKIQREHFYQYTDSLESINHDLRKFQHDYMNILFTIRGYLDDDEIVGLKKYFNEKILMSEKYTLMKNDLINDLKNLGIIELKGILVTRLIMAIKNNIHIQIEIPEKIDEIQIDIIDLSRIVGILIDNAIEGSQVSEEKFAYLAILKTQRNSVLLVIENSFKNEGLNVSDLYKSSVSTKGENRGIGLMNLHEITKKYPNILINTHIENNLFIQEVEFMKEG